MTLAHISPPQRRMLRWHGWMFAAWVILTGWLASAVLLHAFGLRSPQWRWPLSMLAMYAMGFVGGAYVYTRWWQRSRHAAEPLKHASQNEWLAYEESRVNGKGWLATSDDPTGFGALGGLLSSADLLLAIGVAAFVLVLLALLPMMATEMLGGFLAELLLEFVIGAVLARRIFKPRASGEIVASVSRRTWWLGVLAVAIALALGFTASQKYPQAATLSQILKQLI